MISLAYDEKIGELAEAKGKRIAKAVALQESVKVACEKREWDTKKITDRAGEFEKYLTDDSK